MNNFELNEKAQELADTQTPYQIAKMFLTEQHKNSKLQAELEDLEELLDYLQDAIPNIDDLITMFNEEKES